MPSEDALIERIAYAVNGRRTLTPVACPAIWHAGNGIAMLTQPLIVTALLDAASQARFDAARRQHFPAAINFLAAHVTLFHALPGEQVDSVARTMEMVCCAQERASFQTLGLRFLGRGVAYDLDMPEVSALRARLAASWTEWLTPQDRQGFRPHVTVQNKVSPAVARSLMNDLQAANATWQGEVVGLALWRYEGGPWTNIARLHFLARAWR